MDRHLENSGLLVVPGVSGAGKSSLCAGVLPRLRGAGLTPVPEAASWPCLMLTPTRAPLDELAVRIAPIAGVGAAAVRRDLAADPAGFALTVRHAAAAKDADAPQPLQGRKRVLLIVDQFEQLFTQCEHEEERRAFVAALHSAATATGGQEPPALVVLVVRADFEARCAEYPGLAASVQHRYLVTAMTERQLRMAVTAPVAQIGSSIDADLVEVLLGEARSRSRAAVGRIAADPACHPPLSQSELAFIRASGRAHRRRRRVRQSLVATLCVLLLGVGAVAAWAVHAGQIADHRRDIAIADLLAAKSEAMGGTDPTVAALESVAAWRIGHTAEARHAMLAAAARPEIAVLPGPSGAETIARMGRCSCGTSPPTDRRARQSPSPPRR
ncbi:hypothetical protein F8568_025165 [Actinomadura sp. LD22]|uniref:Novel STAND NTPase 1 domain-containing protein n=1 Tax=Actinomadura physcomitrii TaxID=2650748 RepID=A0A6I4MGB0_9ACTN|nr:hypothetical protein [Actinomadura physcomitrii]MWA03615.1 hypothetical protein [Actinomadura physcomitrii]